MKSKKKLKLSVPKYTIINRDGKRYVKMGKKMIRIDDDISERQLIKFIINTLHKKRIRGAVKRREVDRSNIKDKSSSSSSSIPEKKVYDNTLTNTYALTSLLNNNKSSVGIDKLLLELKSNKMDDAKFNKLLTDWFNANVRQTQPSSVSVEDVSDSTPKNKPKVIVPVPTSPIYMPSLASAETPVKDKLYLPAPSDEILKTPASSLVEDEEDEDIIDEPNVSVNTSSSSMLTRSNEKSILEQISDLNKSNETIVSNLDEDASIVNYILDNYTKEYSQGSKGQPFRNAIKKLATVYNIAGLKAGKNGRDTTTVARDILKEIQRMRASKQSGDGKRDDYGLSNVQIDEMMSKYPEYLGTIAHNEIPTRILPNVKEQSRGCFIINTDNANQDGEHWQAVYFDGRPNGDKEINFYDSFGRYADKHILDGINQIAHKLNCKSYLRLKENRIQLQNNNTGNCGFFCVKFLIDRLNGRHFTNATGWDDAITNHSKQGEEAVSHFKKQMGYGPWKFLPSFGDIVRGVKEGARRVYTAITGRKSAPPVVQKLLDEHGDSAIVSIDVARSPVLPVIKSIMNIISSGQIEENKNKLGYDDIYHLYLIIKLKDGKAFKIERNEDLTVSDPNVSSESEVMPVSLKGDITLNQMINKVSSKPGFWTYNARTNNCQNFVFDMLNGSGLMTPTLKDFIMQDAEKLLEDSPITEALSDGLTNLKQSLNILIGGGAKQSQPQHSEPFIETPTINMLNQRIHMIERYIEKLKHDIGMYHAGNMGAINSDGDLSHAERKIIVYQKEIENIKRKLEHEFLEQALIANRPIKGKPLPELPYDVRQHIKKF